MPSPPSPFSVPVVTPFAAARRRRRPRAAPPTQTALRPWFPQDRLPSGSSRARHAPPPLLCSTRRGRRRRSRRQSYTRRHATTLTAVPVVSRSELWFSLSLLLALETKPRPSSPRSSETPPAARHGRRPRLSSVELPSVVPFFPNRVYHHLPHLPLILTGPSPLALDRRNTSRCSHGCRRPLVHYGDPSSGLPLPNSTP